MDWMLFGKIAIGGGIWIATSITAYYIQSNKNNNDKIKNIKIRNCRRQARQMRRFKKNEDQMLF